LYNFLNVVDAPEYTVNVKVVDTTSLQ
jgi:hypothetical protein